MTRKESREKMMQLLFELETSNDFDSETIENKCKEYIKGKEQDRSLAILNSIAENLNSIDEAINKHSKSWKSSRMPKVDLAVLRLAIGESRYSDDVSEAVIVSEAINLVKKYSTDNSASFVHGILGAILKDGQ